MRVHFTSDTHFYHKNIVEYCSRPYRTLDGHPDVQTMNRDMVAKWNAMVGKDDLVIHMGDFGFGAPGRLLGIRQALNGKMLLIRGNHDSKPDKYLLPTDKWAWSFQVGDIHMAHVPPIMSEGKVYGRELRTEPVPEGTKVILCGHVHEKWAELEQDGIKYINVGVDVRGLRPVTAGELGLSPEHVLRLHGRFQKE